MAALEGSLRAQYKIGRSTSCMTGSPATASSAQTVGDDFKECAALEIALSLGAPTSSAFSKRSHLSGTTEDHPI
jgi:hypothetical protein